MTLIGPASDVRSVWRSVRTANASLPSGDNTVRLCPTVATSEMLCATLTGDMSRNHWRDWVSPASANKSPARDYLSRPTDDGRRPLVFVPRRFRPAVKAPPPPRPDDAKMGTVGHSGLSHQRQAVDRHNLSCLALMPVDGCGAWLRATARNLGVARSR